MKSSLLFSAQALSSSLTNTLTNIPWLEEFTKENTAHSERKIWGHSRPQIEKNLTFLPLKDELASSLLKRTRIYSVIEYSHKESTASAFYRSFDNLGLITLDLIYVPKAHRGHGVGYKLLSEMAEENRNQHSVHLILDYANRKAYENYKGNDLAEQLLQVPTLKNLKKVGFTELTHLGQMKIPGDKYIYPEVVLSRQGAISKERILVSLE